MKRKIRNYRLRFLEEESYSVLPEKIQKQKKDYQSLYNRIKKRENTIQKDILKLKKLKNELIILKKERTEKYNELLEFHQMFIPTISITFSGKQKGEKRVDTQGFYKYSNNSWSITMRLKGDKPKNIYIGTDKVLRERLNEIYDTDDFTNKFHKDDKKKIQRTVKSLVEPLIIKELQDIIEKEGSIDGFRNRKRIKGLDYVKLLG